MRKVYLVSIVLAILLVAFVIVNLNSLSAFLVDSLITSSVPLILVSFGEMVVLLGGGIDLSVGSVMSLTTVIVASGVAGHGMSAVAAGLGVGVVFGIANGWLCSLAVLPDLIVTLATGSIAEGLALTVLPVPGGTVPSALAGAASGNVAGVVPWSLVVAVGLGAGLAVVLHRTPLGHHIIASGATRRGAAASGVLVGRSRLTAYVIGGLFASLGGVMLAGLSTSGDPNIGAPYTLECIAAAVVGGTSLFGGEGTVVGVAAGAMVLDVIASIISSLSAPEYLQYVISGGGLVVAVAVTVPAVQRTVKVRGVGRMLRKGGL
jgi:ribose transport system permease protein